MGREEKAPKRQKKKETHTREEHKRARRDDDDRRPHPTARSRVYGGRRRVFRSRPKDYR